MWLGTSIRIKDGGRLQELDDKFSNTKEFESAEAIRVRLRAVMTPKNYDRGFFRKTNDLMIVTTYSFGDDPLVERLHLMEKNSDLGWHGDFYDDVIVSLREFQDSTLTLRVQVYDIDYISAGVTDSIQDFATSAAVVFPQLAPYAHLPGLAANSLKNMVNFIDKNDKIIDRRINLETSTPGSGHALLQPGFFVCFGEERTNEDLQIKYREGLRVEKSNEEEYRDGSYAIVEIDKKYEEQREKEINQKVAKLVAELNGKGRSGESALHFLKQTLEVYTVHRKIDRIMELKEKKEKLSPEEEKLLTELKNDKKVQPYLPKI